MIHGIGTDICKVPRIGEALARSGERFARRVLGPEVEQELAGIVETVAGDAAIRGAIITSGGTPNIAAPA